MMRGTIGRGAVLTLRGPPLPAPARRAGAGPEGGAPEGRGGGALP